MRHSAFLILGLFVSSITALYSAHSLEDPKSGLANVTVTPTLGQAIDLNLEFTSSEGQSATLRDMIAGEKPVILIPVYYSCPRLCPLVLQSVTRLLNDLPLRMGDDYKVLTISFDSREAPEKAREKADHYQASFKDPLIAKSHWRFYVGDELNTRKLTTAIGFGFAPDAGEFAHGAAIMILTPQGKISQYFTDINFSPWDVKLALVEASEGRVGSALDHFLLYCFRFDVTKGKYTWAAWNALRVGVLLSVATCVAVVMLNSRKA